MPRLWSSVSLAAQCYIKRYGAKKLIGGDIIPGLPTLTLMKETATDMNRRMLTIDLFSL